MSDNSKTIIIGLDGATYRVLQPLVDAGVMPTIERFMRDGAWGNLMTTNPPVTCPAWPSMFTGVNPGQHGVFSFSYRDQQSGMMRTAASGDVKAVKVWDILADANKRCGILNVPITFPAQEVNGKMLTGFVSPEDSKHITWPNSLRDDLNKKFGDLHLNWSVLGYRPPEIDKREAHIQNINKLMELRNREFEYLVKQDDYDFFFFVHEYPDRVHHLFYHILDPTYDIHRDPKNKKSLELLQDGHRELDRSIARIVEHFGEEANYMVVSDHGFDGVSQWVYVNNLLAQHGLMSLKKTKTWMDVVTRQMNVPLSMRKTLGLEQKEAWHRQDPYCNPLINYTKSQAFAGPQLEHAIYVNLKGKCPEGIVATGSEQDEVKRKIIDVLSNAIDPTTGQKVFEGVWASEEIYSGPYVKDAPDIIYELAAGYMVSNSILPEGLMRGQFLRPLKPGWDISGYHRPEGVFIGHGPAFAKIQKMEASIYDIAPTVLYLMDIPIPSYMDGRVIESAIKPELLQARSPQSCESDPTFESTDENAYSLEEQMEVTRRLEELGYL